MAGYTPRIVLETKSFETAHALAMAGLGVTFSLATMRQFGQVKHPAYFSLDHPTPSRTVVIAYRKGTYISRIAREFIDTTKKVLADTDVRP